MGGNGNDSTGMGREWQQESHSRTPLARTRVEWTELHCITLDCGRTSELCAVSHLRFVAPFQNMGDTKSTGVKNRGYEHLYFFTQFRGVIGEIS